MAAAVIMPRQGQSVESCIITKWHKQKGDTVKIGDILFSYETDKSSFDEEAKDEGTILAVFAEEGDEVVCLDTVCIIGTPGEDITALMPDNPDAKAEEKAPEEATAAAEKASEIQKTESVPFRSGEKLKISPRARRIADKSGADLAKVSPTGPNGRVIERDVRKLIENGMLVTSAAQNEYNALGRPVEGTGLGGRVSVADLATKPEAAAKKPAAAEAPAAAQEAAYEDIKLPNIRKVIAKQMMASLTTTAQLTFNSSFDATELLNYRSLVKAGGEAAGLANITMNDMILFAVSRVLKNYPKMNAHMLEDTLRVFKNINIGIAVDTERGLLVPTLENADRLSLNELSVNARALINESQKGSINPDKLKGATFTVSNLGSMGIESFTPILNAPQVAILGVCSITRRVKQVGDKDFFYPAMGLSLTVDHRVLDGAPTAKFLKELCFALENFNLLLAK